jgi:hypothetical protein
VEVGGEEEEAEAVAEEEVEEEEAGAEEDEGAGDKRGCVIVALFLFFHLSTRHCHNSPHYSASFS